MSSNRNRFQFSKYVPSFIRSSFRTKLFIAFLILGGSASVDTTLYIGRLLRRVEVVEAQALMFATVVQMAEAADADAIARLATLDDPRTDPAFHEQRERLIEMRAAITNAIDQLKGGHTAEESFIDMYILGPTDQEGWGRFIVTYIEEEAGFEYDMSRFPEMMQAWRQPTAEDRVVTDEFGSTLSAYAPIKDATGNTIAIVGVDVDGVYFRRVLIKTILLASAMFLAAILFSFLFAWLVARFMSRSLDRLESGMLQVADGKLDVSLEPFGNKDEFDRLIVQFNEMITGLRERETLRRDIGEAAHIQSGLLPTAAPKVPGFSISGGIRYCQQAGGDYYDYIDLNREGHTERLWGLAVGDVSGHGVGSALLMCSSRAILRSAAWQGQTDVAGVMNALNEHLVHDSPMNSFMTMFYAVLDPDRRTLHWTNAGHDPGLLVRPGASEVTHLKSTDIPIGIMSDQPFAPGEPIQFQSGDVLVLGTDGVSQAQDTEGNFFGFDQMTDIVRSHAESSAREIRDAIFNATRNHRRGAPPEDDVTLIVIKCE